MGDAIGSRRPVVLVGASMGAYTAALVAGRVPTALLVLLTPMIPAPGESIGTWFAATGQGAAVAAYAAELGLDPGALDPSVHLRTAFFHDLPAALVAEMEAASPPEQAAGKPVTKKSDLYSLGVVLYTLITGDTPSPARAGRRSPSCAGGRASTQVWPVA